MKLSPQRKRFFQSFSTIQVSVTFSSGSAACASGGIGIAVTFTHNPGTHPPLIATALTSGVTLVVKKDGQSASGATSVKGTRERTMCSGRGYCTDKGCVCFIGFSSSDGAGGAGDVGDCGHFSTAGGATSSTDNCPVSFDERLRAGPPVTTDAYSSTEPCWGHGFCDITTGYACVCEGGYTGIYCQHKRCPSEKAWFAEPSADNSAHTYAANGEWECSNRGRCDRSSGQCVCDAPFEGNACERLKCPGLGNGGCNALAAGVASTAALTSQGTCHTMRSLATLAGVSYGDSQASWDADMVQGCACATRHWHGPFAGEVSDFIGHDCASMTCPRGDDPITQGQVFETQTLDCGAAAGSFTLTFDDGSGAATSAAIQHDATPAQIEAALEAMASISDVDVTVSKYSTGVKVGTADKAAGSTAVTVKTVDATGHFSNGDTVFKARGDGGHDVVGVLTSAVQATSLAFSAGTLVDLSVDDVLFARAPICDAAKSAVVTVTFVGETGDVALLTKTSSLVNATGVLVNANTNAGQGTIVTKGVDATTKFSNGDEVYKLSGGTLTLVGTITSNPATALLTMSGTTQTALSADDDLHRIEAGAIIIAEAVKGTLENNECSWRGTCDRVTGRCRCFEGFAMGDGRGGLGTRGDCSYHSQYETTDYGLMYATAGKYVSPLPGTTNTIR